eukprot:14426676-Alexandrium_andersonii.AAC.1
MSASLVGSEMCIRDRLGTHAKHDVIGNGTAVASGEGGGHESHPHVHRTVSYTHLTLPTICSV